MSMLLDHGNREVRGRRPSFPVRITPAAAADRYG